MHSHFSVFRKSAHVSAAQQPKIPGSWLLVPGPSACARGFALKCQTRVYNIFIAAQPAQNVLAYWAGAGAGGPPPTDALLSASEPPWSDSALTAASKRALAAATAAVLSSGRSPFRSMSPSRTPGPAAPGSARRVRTGRA